MGLETRRIGLGKTFPLLWDSVTQGDLSGISSDVSWEDLAGWGGGSVKVTAVTKFFSSVGVFTLTGSTGVYWELSPDHGEAADSWLGFSVGWFD